MSKKSSSFILFAGVVLAVGTLACARLLPDMMQAPAPPSSEEAIRTLPTITPTSPPPTPTATPLPRFGGTAGPGEILYLRDGMLWSIAPGGTSERPMLTLPAGSVGPEAAISPGGQYVAFTIDSREAAVLDLTNGQITTIDEGQDALISSFVWNSDGTQLYYEKLTLKPGEYTISTIEVWQAPMPPSGSSNPITGVDVLPAGVTTVAPTLALSNGLLILNEFKAGNENYSRPLIYVPGGSIVPLFRTEQTITEVVLYSIWDVSADEARILVSSGKPGSIAKPLLIGELSATEGVINLVQISPEDEEAIYQMGRFAADGQRILVIRATQTPASGASELVLLTPEEAGGYSVNILGGEGDAAYSRFVSYDNSTVLVERTAAGDELPGIWLLPLDGSAGTRIASGQMPMVVR